MASSHFGGEPVESEEPLLEDASSVRMGLGKGVSISSSCAPNSSYEEP